jgi:hypothetical protein
MFHILSTLLSSKFQFQTQIHSLHRDIHIDRETTITTRHTHNQTKIKAETEQRGNDLKLQTIKSTETILHDVDYCTKIGGIKIKPRKRQLTSYYAGMQARARARYRYRSDIESIHGYDDRDERKENKEERDESKIESITQFYFKSKIHHKHADGWTGLMIEDIGQRKKSTTTAATRAPKINLSSF